FFDVLSEVGLAGAAGCWVALLAAGVVCEPLSVVELVVAASFTCTGRGGAGSPAGLPAAGCRSFCISGIAVLLAFPEAGTPFTAPVLAPGAASDRGMGAFSGGGAPLSVRSTETLLPVLGPKLLMTLLLAARTMSGALDCLGSTRVGSPTFAASETFGPLWKFSITLPTVPGAWRLAISALSCAMAASVAFGTGRFMASRRFLASLARSSRGYLVSIRS